MLRVPACRSGVRRRWPLRSLSSCLPAPLRALRPRTPSRRSTSNDDDRPTVLINTGNGVAVSEDTPTTDDTYKVRLGSQPDANVQVVASADDGETLVYTDGAPACSVVLTFTPDTFATAQMVHVLAVDDADVEARPHAGTLTHKIRGSATGFSTD